MSQHSPPVDISNTDGQYPGLNETTVIVTGASNGIGRATAAVLSASGATVYGLDIEAEPSDDGPPFDDVVDNGKLVVGDVTDRAVVEAIVDDAAHENGLDAVINNAGTRGSGPLAAVSPEDWDRTFGIHVGGTRNVCQAALPELLASPRGSIVNVTSIAALGAYAGAADYAAAKSAIIGLTQQLSADYSSEGLRVNAVAPGFIRTRMNASVWQADDGSVRDDLQENPVVERTLLPFTAEPVDIGQMIAFLCSDAARFVTGQVIPVDGGWSV